jgi:hypothetical protein
MQVARNASTGTTCHHKHSTITERRPNCNNLKSISEDFIAGARQELNILGLWTGVRAEIEFFGLMDQARIVR